MIKIFILFILIFCSSCSNPDDIDPGDQGTIGWTPQEQIFGPIIDCKGQSRGNLSITQSGTIVRNCIINGNIRVHGLDRNANKEIYKEKSKEKEYVTWARTTSPSWVIIEDTKIIGINTIPLYLSVGVTMTTIRNVEISGYSDSTMVYFDAETYGTKMENVIIDARNASREAIAIDASNYNNLNVTINHKNGGIYMYRNCGEFGTSRHTTPSDNIINGTITGKGIAVWLGSREGNRNYCGLDKDNNYGSGISNFDHSRRNTIHINTDGVILKGISSDNNVINITNN